MPLDKETRRIYQQWYRNHQDKMSFDDYKKQIGFQNSKPKISKPENSKPSKPKKISLPVHSVRIKNNLTNQEKTLSELISYIDALGGGHKQYQNFGFKSTSEMKAKIISMIYDLSRR